MFGKVGEKRNMKYEDCATKSDLVDYYEEFLDFLDDHVPNLSDLIALFEEEDE